MASRRNFLAAAAAVGGAGLASVGGADPARAAEDVGGAGAMRDLYELRRYVLADEAQRHGLDAFLRDAAIPALNRIGIAPVGVFHPMQGVGPVHVLLRHRSMDSVATSTQKLLADTEYLAKGATFLDAPASKPAFRRMESCLLLAFAGMPTLEVPEKKGPGRVVQLRTYESPSVKTGRKKIEMFGDAGEIRIFRRTGLNPVFFGEALVGEKMPNLTYMLAFESEDELKANWKTFIADPEWKSLSGKPEYANDAILSGITNTVLKPAEYSQV